MKTIRCVMWLIACAVLIAGCSTLELKLADFSWPVESVVNVDNSGNVDVQRYSFSFNAKELFLKETGDSLGYQNQQVRIIRNAAGYYFMTANNFKNVYVFNANKGKLSLEKKIDIADTTSLLDPAFNQRTPFVELVYGDNGGNKVNLTEKGIVKEEEKK